jgi:arabinogalactan endo-1,4-beta-galactosidase
MKRRRNDVLFIVLVSLCFGDCLRKDEIMSNQLPENPIVQGLFYFGADLSYVNQILDHNGVYKDGGEVKNPYQIFKDHGTNLVRLRLWHNPIWTKEVYGVEGTQLYNDLKDVHKAIAAAKDQKIEILLDMQYSDTWADPGKQEIPLAWREITDLEVLKDSVYRYTKNVLLSLEKNGLMPEFIQLGNEINCGMLYSNALPDFPTCSACNGQWRNLGEVINSGVKAVREVSSISSVHTKIVLHVADPKNVQWWFDNIMNNAKVDDFDIIGFSYYPLWHTTVTVDKLRENVEAFRNRYKKQIMILETAYPWTTDGKDAYDNIFSSQNPIAGYPYSPQGQLDMMKTLTQELKSGGGYGIIYWEPAWISSDMKDLWGTGSSWENSALFDFDGNTLEGFDYMDTEYK